MRSFLSEPFGETMGDGVDRKAMEHRRAVAVGDRAILEAEARDARIAGNQSVKHSRTGSTNTMRWRGGFVRAGRRALA